MEAKIFPILGEKQPIKPPIIAPINAPGHILSNPKLESVTMIIRTSNIAPEKPPPNMPPRAPRIRIRIGNCIFTLIA
jgi:hypothetical protein